MSDHEVLIEQLRRSNRRWKALALAACSALALMVIASFVGVAWQRARAEVAMRAANEALRSANEARVDAQRAANPGQPRCCCRRRKIRRGGRAQTSRNRLIGKMFNICWQPAGRSLK
jgi:hypothetical protein